MRQKREQKQFTKVPWLWRIRLRKATRVSTFKLALFLLHRHWQSDGKPVPVSALAMEEEGLSPRSKSNALGELESLDLITLERHNGKAPRATLQHL
jgi:hypothetical protein